jgi:hypothetical protein
MLECRKARAKVKKEEEEGGLYTFTTVKNAAHAAHLMRLKRQWLDFHLTLTA